MMTNQKEKSLLKYQKKNKNGISEMGKAKA